ncbi:hypothetical protein FRC10_002455, partial [Ceratobasidium sp. 414]
MQSNIAPYETMNNPIPDCMGDSSQSHSQPNRSDKCPIAGLDLDIPSIEFALGLSTRETDRAERQDKDLEDKCLALTGMMEDLETLKASGPPGAFGSQGM